MRQHLLKATWFGKALGLTIACVTAFSGASFDPTRLSIGIIIGITLGHGYDLWMAYAAREKQTHQRSRHKAGTPYNAQAWQQAEVREFLFTTLGYLAKSGGVVHPGHIRFAEHLIQQAQGNDPALNPQALRQQAITWFSAGKDGRINLQRLAQRCHRHLDERTRHELLHLLAQQAAVSPTNATLSTLKTIGGQLKFTPAEIANEFGEAQQAAAQPQKAQSHRQSTTPPKPPPGPQTKDMPPQVQAAFRCLDIAPDAPMHKVKLAYRRMVSRYHPDRLAGRGDTQANAEALRLAQQRMVEMRDALETIQVYRGQN